MSYSQKHLSDREILPQQRRAARGCWLTALVMLLATGMATVIAVFGGLPGW